MHRKENQKVHREKEQRGHWAHSRGPGWPQRFSVAALAVLLAALGVLSGCSAQEQEYVSTAESEDITLEVWICYDRNVPGAYYVFDWDDLAQEYGCEIEVKTYSVQEIQSKLEVALAGNELPDIFYVPGDSFADAVFESGACMVLNAYLEDAGYREEYLQTASDGNYYLVPAFPESYAAVYYNTELMELMGLSVPESKEELLELVEIVEAYNQENGTDYNAIELGEKDGWMGALLFCAAAWLEDPDAYAAAVSESAAGAGVASAADGVEETESAEKTESTDVAGETKSSEAADDAEETESADEAAGGQDSGGDDAQDAGNTDRTASIEAFALAADFLLELSEAGAFSDTALETGEPEAVKNFIGGSSVLMVHQTSLVYHLIQNLGEDGFEMQVLTAENEEDGESAVLSLNPYYIAGFAVSSRSEYPDLAAQICVAFAETVNQTNVEDYGYLNMMEEVYEPGMSFSENVRSIRDAAGETDRTDGFAYALLDQDKADRWSSLLKTFYSGELDLDELQESTEELFSEE